jgi:N-acetylglucosaminyldiphosphoundecaprenol N-acetyl-beta-D-mannosaminyltransferase
MSFDAVKILEINITKTPKSGILKEIQKYLRLQPTTYKLQPQKAPKPLVIVTPNPEQIVYAQGDSRFREILNRADISLPDGTGVLWASRFLSLPTTHYPLQPISQTIPGVEFMENLVSIALKQRVPIALIGGRDGLALKTLECLQKKHPGLSGWAIDGPEMEILNQGIRIKESGIERIKKSLIPNMKPLIQHGHSEEYFNQLAKRIIDSRVGMVFVGLGAPKQEYFIERLSGRLPTTHYPLPTVFMSVGGSFDEIAGRLPRAPKLISGLCLKWLWRLILEPWRFRRQLALIRFVWLVLKKRYILK